MCGIAGWLGNLDDGQRYVCPVIDALRHRGPDSQGSRSWTDGTLIHTRLSIIDLAPTGAQPMANEDETIWTVFNGEIYNHHELRSQLEAKGHRFRGHSDTEILPHLYEEYGEHFLPTLRGMFALAIYDIKNRTLVLARDRFGIKPLFYAAVEDRLMFASEINALRTFPGIDDRPDPQAISDFASLFYIPAPQTFFAGIRALSPGESIRARFNGDTVSHCTRIYHKWVIAPDRTMTLADAEERTADLLTSAVRRQMESDVPLGALLSGGIDSSLVSAAAQSCLDSQLRTFNVRFSDREYDETPAAVDTAQHIRSHHQTLEMDEVDGSWEHVTGLLLHAGQPFADSSLFAANAVCRLMRQHVTVALSGDGGDEAFGGYALYGRLPAIRYWQLLPAPVTRGASVFLRRLEDLAISPARLSQRLVQLSNSDNTSIIQNLLCWIRADEHQRLCKGLRALPVRRLFEAGWEHRFPSSVSRLERLSAHATEVYGRLLLPNDFLFKVDTASMRESLEVRVPLLDEDLFAFGLSLPHVLKAQGQNSKRVLRGIAKKWLPHSVATRPKQGFRIPIDRWVTPAFKLRLRETLLGRSTRLRDFFHIDSYRPIVDAFCAERPCPDISRQGLYQRAMMLLSVHLALTRD